MWYIELCKEVGVQDGKSQSVSGWNLEGIKKNKLLIEVESISRQYMRAIGPYKRSPAACPSLHTKVAENYIHLWCMRYSWRISGSNEILGPPRSTHNVYMMHERDKKYHPDFSREEDLATDEWNCGQGRAPNLQQKYVELMQDVIQQFMWPGRTDLDPSAGTCGIAKNCLLLSKHRFFLDWKIDAVCFK